MAFCKACGSELGSAAFCPKCGASQNAATVGATSASSEGLAENIAGLLCYALGWITGIIFLLIDKRPFVRFHAAQSIVVFGALTIFRIGLAIILNFGGVFGFGALTINDSRIISNVVTFNPFLGTSTSVSGEGAGVQTELHLHSVRP